MCGISAIIANGNGVLSTTDIEHAVRSIQRRGPDESRMVLAKNGTVRFDFHRLAINGAMGDPLSMQPFETIGHWIVACNGEIYNWRELASEYDLNIQGGSDCEVIGHLLEAGIPVHAMVGMLDGVFAFAAYNKRTEEFVAARDPFGVRSLFIGTNHAATATVRLCVASELKCVASMGCTHISPFPPGKVFAYNSVRDTEVWTRHHVELKPGFFPYFQHMDVSQLAEMVREELTKSVRRRMMTDRNAPIGCFLSGGLDSSLIASLVVRETVRSGGSPADIYTFSIGQPEATDMVFAKEVASFLGTTHHEVFVSEERETISTRRRETKTEPSMRRNTEPTVKPRIPYFLLCLGLNGQTLDGELNGAALMGCCASSNPENDCAPTAL